MALKENFMMRAGDTYKITVTVNDKSGNPVNITNASAEFAVATAPNGDAIITKSVGDGISITDGPNGVLMVTLAPADTKNLQPHEYFHELKVTVSGERNTVLYGNINILGSILR